MAKKDSDNSPAPDEYKPCHFIEVAEKDLPTMRSVGQKMHIAILGKLVGIRQDSKGKHFTLTVEQDQCKVISTSDWDELTEDD
jgi:hypothetical protein